jgi:uncharacterized membrane protein
MAQNTKPTFLQDFRHFFVRGLAILLPTVITIWLLVAVYRFVDVKFAAPLNTAVQQLVLLTPWPKPQPADYLYAQDHLTPQQQADLSALSQSERQRLGPQWTPQAEDQLRRAWLQTPARQVALERVWSAVSIGGWAVMDLIGLVIAIVLIYSAGAIVTSLLGRQLYQRGERLLERVPLIRRVYPSIKQVTDFFFGQEKRLQFNRVVAVQYPRKDLWSIALVTGAPQDPANPQPEFLTLFVPSSPTPFTGYVIIAPKADTIELPISIEEAMRFLVSGGLVQPQGVPLTTRLPAAASTLTQTSGAST